MPTIIQSIILGIAQGLGEFLPISSTAHLILIPYFAGWPDPGLSFDVALHLGTLVAVLVFFWKDWLRIFKSAYLSIQQNGFKKMNEEMLYYIIIATIPGALFGVLFEKKAETVFRSPLLIALALIIVGYILYQADKKNKGERGLANINLKDSILIGLSQAVAIIPGVSRSGATISSGLFRGINKADAARFSFLLSTPIIAGAAILKLPHLFQEGIDANLLAGILASAISGYLAIKYLLQFLNKDNYRIFFWYRLIVGLAVILFYFLK